MRIFILGIDALEFKLVEDFDLTNLKQSEYGKVSIPTECYTIGLKEMWTPWTPFIWSAFLTGKTPDQTGIGKLNYRKWENKALQFLREKSAKIGLNKIKGKAKILNALGFKQRYHNRTDFKVKTVFDLARSPIDIGVPCYSKDWKFKLDSSKDDINAYFKESLSDFKKNRAATLNRMDEEWDLFFSYARHLDICGHLFISKRTKMWENYILLDDFAKQIVTRLPKKTLFLIVSDHGMEQLEGSKFGKHSERAYYSSNIPLELKAPSITDFYEIIKEKLSNDQ